MTVMMADPHGIELAGFDHGFFGGCCGVINDTVVITGSLAHFPDGQKVSRFLKEQGCPWVELYDGPLVDVGSLLFLH